MLAISLWSQSPGTLMLDIAGPPLQEVSAFHHPHLSPVAKLLALSGPWVQLGPRMQGSVGLLWE